MIEELIKFESEAFEKLGCPQILHLFVRRHGKVMPGSVLPSNILPGKKKQCFMNALNLAVEEGFTYCEGFGVTPGCPILIHHAWCVDKSGRVVDNTWSDPEHSEYFGVSLEIDGVIETVGNKKTYGVLGFERDCREFMFKMDPALEGEFFSSKKRGSRTPSSS